jgi:drug/metabolite transporter (DMT)-like permease
MLVVSHGIFKKRLPKGKEWKQIAIYALLNITIYLGCYVIAMQNVSAGVGALAIASNPVMISFLSVIFLKQKLKVNILIALLLGTVGVVYASWPLLHDLSVTPGGLILLMFSMLSYSVGQIYFSSKNWSGLTILTINGWQTMIGGAFLLPFTIFSYSGVENNYNLVFWLSTLWLAVPVSIFAVQIWLWLLQKNTVRAGLWLFLCPVFGFAIAAVMLHEPISSYTVIGVILVLVGLYLAKRNSRLEQE